MHVYIRDPTGASIAQCHRHQNRRKSAVRAARGKKRRQRDPMTGVYVKQQASSAELKAHDNYEAASCYLAKLMKSRMTTFQREAVLCM